MALTRGITIRRATAQDLAAIVRLLADDVLGRHREDAGPEINARYRDAFAAIAADPNQFLAVAEDDGAVVGCLQLSFMSGLSRLGAWRGQIESVRIASARRGSGLGRTMFEWAIAQCRERGCSLVQLTTDKARPDALRFYESLGFVASHEGLKLGLDIEQHEGNPEMSKIGFIGLGTMGGSFARNVQKAGYDLVVHDLHRHVAQPHLDAGATWADSARALAARCDVVLTSLPGPPEVTAVAAELAEGLKPGSAVFDLSTNAPAVVRQLHADFAKRGLHFLDAPVSGGPKGALSGRCAIWVGGDRAVFDKHRKVLDAMGDQVRYIGPIGAGSIAKLVHNAAGYAIQCALAEVFSVGAKAGVEPLALFEAVRQGARGRVRTFDMLADQFLVNHYDPPSFALRLAHKDVSLAVQLGQEVGVPMRMINLALQELTEARGRGWDHRDSRAAMLLQLERAGIEFHEAPDAVRAVLDADGAK